MQHRRITDWEHLDSVLSVASVRSTMSVLKQARYRPLADGNIKDCLNRAMLGGVNHCGLGQFYLE